MGSGGAGVCVGGERVGGRRGEGLWMEEGQLDVWPCRKPVDEVGVCRVNGGEIGRAHV